jgi:predicted DCC family thiol-disulfide oxidoreductase YuxK
MTELSLLIFFLGVAFILAPFMTKNFFLRNSQVYLRAHALCLLILFLGGVLDFNWIAAIWPLFCILGFFLYLKQEGRLIFSVKGFASCIPFVFSLISSAWFFSGTNDLHLLGYNKNWSFYAALHGSILGWFFVGCLAKLSQRPNASKIYLFGCYLCFLLFLSVAFGIDGIPHIKRVGVIGLSIFVPFAIGLFTFSLKKENRLSLLFAVISLFSIAVSMTIAILNEFWVDFPKVAFGMPIMTLTHGLINALFTVPCFYLAVRLATEEPSRQTNEDKNVIFFDGLCVLCNGTVSKLIKIDRKRILKYSSLQGEYAKNILDVDHTKSGASVVFLNRGHLYLRAEAVIYILLVLGGIYKLAAMFLNIFPLFILNQLYDLIARNRYRLFGIRDTCLAPTNENKDLFIS